MAASRARAARRVTTPILVVETPHGAAHAHVWAMDAPTGALILGHGAGGGVNAPDVAAAADAGRELNLTVVLVEQPYRVAGRRSPAPAAQLDAAWLAVVSELRHRGVLQVPLIVGGRSAGARVACRTASETRARAVLCLAFPLHPPGRADDPSKSRLPELESVRVPVLVVQGDRDPFGMPPPSPTRAVITVTGNHSLRSPAAVKAAVAAWLPEVLT